MDTDLRSSLVAALAAALLSALVGAIAGVGFVAVLLRALLGGAAFGGLVYGGIFLARRSLPGLALGESPSDDGLAPFEGEAVMGNAVDIVLPGEGPSQPSPPEGSADGVAAPEAAVPRPIEPAPDFGRASAQEEAPRATARQAAPSLEEEERDAEEVGSLLGPEEAGSGEAAIPPVDGGGAFEDLDVLPDLDGFSDSFAPADVHAAGTESPSARGASSGASMGGFGGRSDSLDPTQLAQAVRTMLKRDQKG